MIVRDPVTQALLSGNIVPVNRIDPAEARRLLNLLPPPKRGGYQRQPPVQLASISSLWINRADKVILRVDYNISLKDLILRAPVERLSGIPAATGLVFSARPATGLS